jgi:hypothetical protein
VFGCKCFILKKEKLDKFEARSSDGIFFGYASHSWAYRVLNLITNQESYKLSFDKMKPCGSIAFECVDDDKLGETIFEHEKEEVVEDDIEGVPAAELVPTTSMTTITMVDGPFPTL